MSVLESTEGMVTRVRVLTGSDADPVRLAGKVPVAKSDCTYFEAEPGNPSGGGTVILGVAWFDQEFFHDRRDAWLGAMHTRIYQRLGIPLDDVTVTHWAAVTSCDPRPRHTVPARSTRAPFGRLTSRTSRPDRPRYATLVTAVSFKPVSSWSKGSSVDHIITRLGFAEEDSKLLHDRRGTAVYKIGDTALKITSGLMAGREGEILDLLGNETYRAHGWDGERPWLTLRWINGTGLWTALEQAHQGEDSTATRHHVLAMTADAAHELTHLHAAGWVHGDLQPDHIIFADDRTHLIDLACAQGPAKVPFYVHRGGLAHTTAPEIADLILSSDGHVTITPQADMWSLGASLWWSWTRTTPIAYTDPAGRRAALLADIAAARRPDPTAVRPWPFPAFEDAVMACLAADPDKRPTAKELATSLL